MSVQDDIRQTAGQLLADGKVDLVIGFAEGTLAMKAAPCFITAADDVEQLVWNSFCLNNLAVYLSRCFTPDPQLREPPPPPKVAVIVKGCDGRSVVGLIKEQQAPRENLTIIAVPCDGMLDADVARRVLGAEEIVAADEVDGAVKITDETGKETTVDRKELLAEACRFCTHRAAAVYDQAIGELPADADPLAPDDRFEAYCQKPTADKWRQFCSEISKCVLCKACRSACPNCYCRTCFADQTRPNWMGSGAKLGDVIFYHLGRLFHQAGRCVDCGACVRACPVGVDLRTFTYKLVEDAEQLFDFTPGLDLEQAPPLTVFAPGDSENFITDPE